MKFHRDTFHNTEIGTSRVLSLTHGRFYVSVERYTGVYGQRHTVTYGFKWSCSW